MNVELYKTISNRNKINKVLTDVKIFDCKLLNETNVLQPILILSDNQNNLIDYNYCYIPYYKRYYFIENINKNLNGLITLKLNVDVLMSYRNDILNSYAVIIESENPSEENINHIHSDNIRKLEYNYNDVFNHNGKLYLTCSYGVN